MSRRALSELIRGEGAHADALECFRGLTAEQAGQRPPGFPHSAWQLLGHVNYWMDYELVRIAGRDVAYPEHASGSWPADPAPVDGHAWGAAVALFAQLLDEMSRLAESPEDALRRPVPAAHGSQTRHDATLEGVLWQTIVHNTYHLGQVALLRRALGAWPPPGGGDTW